MATSNALADLASVEREMRALVAKMEDAWPPLHRREVEVSCSLENWADLIEQAREELGGTVFRVGDRVVVLRASRLPAVEESTGEGVITHITPEGCYRVEGFPMVRDARVLRPVVTEVCHEQ